MAFESGSELEREWVDRTGRRSDGRVGEATGEEGGERGGSVAVRAALGGAGVGGVGGANGLAEEAWEEAQFGERRVW